jgi:RNA polymerase sigma-70 factor (ECF subfamily)
MIAERIDLPEIAFSEVSLVQRLIERDETALSDLYAQYSRLVYSIAMRTVQNPHLAEEVTQDTFLKIWDQAERWNPQRGRFSSWLIAITRYTAIDHLRKEQRRPIQNAIEWDDVRLGQAALVDDLTWQDGWMLHAYMERLPEEQEQAIELAFFQGMSHTEMAEYLNLPLGTVKTRVRLALKKLKSYPIG